MVKPWMNVMVVIALLTAYFASACAAPPVRTPTVAPAARSEARVEATVTRRVVLVPPTRTPTPTIVPAATIPPLQSGTVRVDIGDSFFYPDLITVTVGSKIQWHHIGNNMHDVTGIDRSWQTGITPYHGTLEREFLTPGVYAYYCSFHRPAMSATIVVQ